MLNASITTKKAIPPAFSDPRPSLVVMPEDTENDLSQTHLALEGLAWILEGAADMNAALLGAGKSGKLIEIPPDCLAALMRTMSERIKPATANPTLSAVHKLRPDLFKLSTGGK